MSASVTSKTVDTPAFHAYDPACPSRALLEHVTSRWGVLVLGVLQERTYRFSELRRQLGGVTEKMLAQTLRTLEHDGLLRRDVYPQVPPRVEYSLTVPGREVAALTGALITWVELHASALLD